MKTVLITGTSSGIGEASVRFFLEQGWNVVAGMKRVQENPFEESEHLTVVALDVTDTTSIERAVSFACEKYGAIDVLVNNAGYGLLGPIEELSNEALTRQFQTNVLGLINLTREVLPRMRANNQGVVVNVSSVMGRVSFPFFSAYAASKWAVEGFSESLMFETAPFGIRIKLIEPGTIRTKFFRNAERAPFEGVHKESWSRVWNNVSSRGSSGANPRDAARVIYQAVNDTSSRLRYPVDTLSILLPFLRSLVPLSMFQRMLRMTVR